MILFIFLLLFFFALIYIFYIIKKYIYIFQFIVCIKYYHILMLYYFKMMLMCSYRAFAIRSFSYKLFCLYFRLVFSILIVCCVDRFVEMLVKNAFLCQKEIVAWLPAHTHTHTWRVTF